MANINKLGMNNLKITSIARPITLVAILMASSGLLRNGSYVSFGICILLMLLTAYRKCSMPAIVRDYYKWWYITALVLMVIFIPLQFK